MNDISGTIIIVLWATLRLALPFGLLFYFGERNRRSTLRIINRM
ncbi:MAG TPA: hypothetical protein VLX61_12215 [Anaerolineales bacterium]|nr:hypothetical protein [Anaerolineales bacterium]